MKSGSIAGGLFLGCWLSSGAGGHPLDLNKRKLVTEVVFVTETVANAIVYVDESGIPYSTSTVDRSASIATTVADSTPILSFVVPTAVGTVEPAAPLSVQSSATTVSSISHTFLAGPSVTVQDTASTPALAHVSGSIAVNPPSPVSPTTSKFIPPLPPSPSSSAPSPEIPESSSLPDLEPSVSSDEKLPLGVTYDTFKVSNGETSCKTGDEMAKEFGNMKDFKVVRIYGNDCGVIPIAVQQAKKNGQSLMAGIYRPNQAINDVVSALSDAINRYNNGDWSIIKLASVENERVNSHVMTASDAQDSISNARQALRGAGYQGPVGVVETAPVYVDNPSICANADIVLANIHAFFDPNTAAKDAGTFVKSEVARVRKACSNKRVVVTESGWPHQGNNHDKAVASPDAQKAAIKSIKDAFDGDLFLFNAFDSLWKNDDDTTWGAEKYWGIL